MATSTYIALANITLTATDSSVVFSSIPATYRDLVLVLNAEMSSASTNDVYLRLNEDASNHTQVNMRGTGSATSSVTYSTITLNAASTFSVSRLYTVICHIMDYSATDKHKTVLTRGNWAGGDINATAGRWASTTAVSSFSLVPSAGSFAIGSTFALYGIVS